MVLYEVVVKALGMHRRVKFQGKQDENTRLYMIAVYMHIFLHRRVSLFQAEKRKSVISPSKKVPISLD